MIIQTLLVGNIFVIFYNLLLFLLNSKFPVEASNQFIRGGAVPEPFEIPLYLILSGIIVLVLYFLNSKPVKKTNANYSYLKAGVLIFLLITFLTNLGTYPMAHNNYPRSFAESQFTYLSIFIICMLLTVFIVVGSYILRPMIKKNKFIFFGIIFFITFFITFITLDPQFDIYSHDYSYFFGPVWEIAHGKTIFSQTPSQYGFVSILILSFLQKTNILSALYLPVIIWFFYIIEYSVFFYLILKVSRSLAFSLIGLFSLITINYLSLYHLPAMAPQVGPFRWLPLIICAFLFFKLKKIDSKLFIFFVALASFWVIDSGIFLILAYTSTLILLVLKRRVTLKQSFISLSLLILFILGIFALINLIHLGLGYQLINPVLIFSKIKEYGSSGFGMLPMETKTYFWFTPLIYFASIIYFFRQKQNEFKEEVLSGGTSGRVPDDAQRGSFPQRASAGRKLVTESDKNNNLNIQLLLLSANLSLFASVYFVGRSHPHNLFHISIFLLLNVFILFGLLIKNNLSQNPSKLMIPFIYSLLFIIFIAYPFYQRQEAAANLLSTKLAEYKSGRIFVLDWWNGFYFYYENEMKLIKKELPENKILILSPDDTYLFYLTGKENLMYDNSQFTILTEKEMNFSSQDVYRTCPQKIVADCGLFDKCQNNRPFTEIAGFNIQTFLLANIENKCRIKYIPQICTDKLCIATQTKKP